MSSIGKIASKLLGSSKSGAGSTSRPTGGTSTGTGSTGAGGSSTDAAIGKGVKAAVRKLRR